MEGSSSPYRERCCVLKSRTMTTTSQRHMLLQSDTYIEKDASINEEVGGAWSLATSSLLSRRDVIVKLHLWSCIYGITALVRLRKVRT